MLPSSKLAATSLIALGAAALIGLASPARAVDSTGLIPIPDMDPGENFEGFPGGLYPNRLNYLFGRALADRLHGAQRIVPRNAAGAAALPADGGRIVLLSIGMSNTSQEYTAFMSLANSYPDRNPALVVVNGAQGGQTAADIAIPTANFWNVVNQRLAAAGVTPQQVQAIWFKEANRQPSGPVTIEIATLRQQFEQIMQIIRARYPNTQIVYSSSRTYAGYAETPLNPEPYAYGSGFAVQTLIRDQILGLDPGLEWGPGGVAPLMQWSAYLWADGLAGREDGLIWERDDFEADGTHPSALGETKVANLLLDFFSTDPTARMWFLRPAAQQLIGDMNDDGNISPTDIGAFVLALSDPAAYAATFPAVDLLQAGDLNDDGGFSVTDISGFVALLANW